MVCGNEGWGGRGHRGGEQLLAGLRAKLLLPAIYCSNPRPDAVVESGSWY